MRAPRLAWLLGAGLALLGPAAAAQEAMTCTGDPPVPTAPAPVEVAPPPAPEPPAPRWADLALAGVVVAVGALGLARLRAVRRRELQAGGLPPRTEAAPYLAGAGLGVLFAVSELVFARPVGASGAFVHLARGEGMSWPVWIIVGVVAGGLVAALATGRFRWSLVPDAWAERHGPSVARRAAVTFLAAVGMEIAAVIAGGCTSGLALSGGIGLAPGAFVFMAAMFATGVPAAWLVHGPRRRS